MLSNSGSQSKPVQLFRIFSLSLAATHPQLAIKPVWRTLPLFTNPTIWACNIPCFYPLVRGDSVLCCFRLIKVPLHIYIASDPEFSWSIYWNGITFPVYHFDLKTRKFSTSIYVYSFWLLVLCEDSSLFHLNVGSSTSVIHLTSTFHHT